MWGEEGGSISLSPINTTDMCHLIIGFMVLVCVHVGGIVGLCKQTVLCQLFFLLLLQNPSTETVKKWDNKFTMRR